MQRIVITDKAYRYERITKAEARKRFTLDKPFQIIAHKMRPGFPFAMDMLIDPAHIKANRSLTPTYSTLESLFDATLTDFAYYNCDRECGLYPAFYVRTAKAVL